MWSDQRVENSGLCLWQSDGANSSNSSASTPASNGAAAGGREALAIEMGERCEQLHRRLKRIVKARGSLDLQEAEALREAQKMQMWRRYGYASLLEYMELELGYTPRAAQDRLRVANALPELPQIAAAIEQGELTFCGARELTRVATPETEQVWLGATKDMNVRELEHAVAGHHRGELPTDPPDPHLQTRVLRYEVSPEVFAMMRQVQLLLAKERGERLGDNGLIEALCRSILDGSRASPGGTTTGPNGGDVEHHRQIDGNGMDHLDDHNEDTDAGCRTMAAYQVAVTVCKQCKRGWQDGAGIVVEMSPPAVERALCDSQDIGCLEGDGSQRAKQAIPPNVRRIVLRRDHGVCQVAGCRSVRNVDLHHIRHREHGGTHTVDNLTVLCESHHLAAHDGSICIERVGGVIKVVREGRNAFTRATRAIATARVLRGRGIERSVVHDAIDKTRTHVGANDLSLEQWTAIAERYLEEARVAKE